jgi:hypothetical protein
VRARGMRAFGALRLRTPAESFRRLPPAPILLSWCVWLLAALLAVEPVAANRCLFGTCGESGTPAVYERDTSATVTRPEAELRARSLKGAAEPEGAGAWATAHLSAFLAELPPSRPQALHGVIVRRSPAHAGPTARAPPREAASAA